MEVRGQTDARVSIDNYCCVLSQICFHECKVSHRMDSYTVFCTDSQTLKGVIYRHLNVKKFTCISYEWEFHISSALFRCHNGQTTEMRFLEGDLRGRADLLKYEGRIFYILFYINNLRNKSVKWSKSQNAYEKCVNFLAHFSAYASLNRSSVDKRRKLDFSEPPDIEYSCRWTSKAWPQWSWVHISAFYAIVGEKYAQQCIHPYYAWILNYLTLV